MLGQWRSRILLLAIIVVTAFSLITVWPGRPNRYLPSFIPWPEGTGWPLIIKGHQIPLKFITLKNGTFAISEIKRPEMALGLDLRGGTRLVLEPEPGVDVPDLKAALAGAKDVIERRVNAFGVAESDVNLLGKDRIAVELPGIKAQEAVDKIGRTALLEFCEPVQDSAGQIATVQQGTVKYQAQSCDPVRDAQQNIVVDGGSITYAPWSSTNPPGAAFRDQIVWQPAKGDLNGQSTALTGKYLKANTAVVPNPNPVAALQQPFLLTFEFNGDGATISGEVTDRLSQSKLPLAVFLDGQPIMGDSQHIIAPSVQSKITSQGEITGLSVKEARNLSTLLNTGAFPIPLRVIERQDVDATLGETAVRDSVIAGEVALLIIMAFMILYYRLPGVMASLALLCYTSFVLAIFKLLPVTLTLSGVAAFVLSLGMAVDANILIFERMKEELRIGRNLIAALEDGFRRAWSSIRDSNISTLITCAILYWFGNQFNESAIKGFAITLAIGVLVSLFSAITVTRTFMYLVIRIRPLARQLWLFVPDLPLEMRHAPGAGRLPAMAGGAGVEPAARSRSRPSPREER
jgi:preprotein translocase subunit SecD